MYSGLVLTKYSGRLMGAHQKIDRISRRHLGELLPSNSSFPKIREILQFEGEKGPDGIKKKSPSKDEPWHYLDPLSEETDNFYKIIENHYKSLVTALKNKSSESAAFNAAWLAHAIVDGLTPAHHYPYEEKLIELRGGRGIELRTTALQKLVYVNDTIGKTIINTGKAYGPKGLITAHALFEGGFTLIIRPLRLPDARPSIEDLAELEKLGPSGYFKQHAREIAVREMYEEYLAKGWTAKLSNTVRHHLAPTMVNTVTVLWYGAAKEAGLCAP